MGFLDRSLLNRYKKDLLEGDEAARLNALACLGKIDHPGAYDLIFSALLNHPGSIRDFAFEVLAAQKDKALVRQRMAEFWLEHGAQLIFPEEIKKVFRLGNHQTEPVEAEFESQAPIPDQRKPATYKISPARVTIYFGVLLASLGGLALAFKDAPLISALMLSLGLLISVFHRPILKRFRIDGLIIIFIGLAFIATPIKNTIALYQGVSADAAKKYDAQNPQDYEVVKKFGGLVTERRQATEREIRQAAKKEGLTDFAAAGLFVITIPVIIGLFLISKGLKRMADGSPD